MAKGILLVVLIVLVVGAVYGDVPRPWKSTGKAPAPESPIRLTLSLQQENLAELERLFWERSNPKHHLYAQYLTRQQLADLISPGGVHERAVRLWLMASGVRPEQITGVETRDVLYVDTTIAVAEALLQVHYEIFEHRHAARKLWRSADEYSLPPMMHKHIQMIHGVTDFPPLRRRNSLRNQHHARESNKHKHWQEMQQVQADSAPAIVITEVNGRSQLPGSVVEVYAKFTCPNGGTDCITSMYATATSANPNIKYQSSSSVENISSTTCPNQECHLVLSAEFYV